MESESNRTACIVCDLKLMDDEEFFRLAERQSGEIVVRAPGSAQTYYKEERGVKTCGNMVMCIGDMAYMEPNGTAVIVIGRM